MSTGVYAMRGMGQLMSRARGTWSASKSKHVHTGISEVDKAAWNSGTPPTGADTFAAISMQLKSFSVPLPSQVYAFQRGLAKVALKLPGHEREVALVEVLAAMGILDRVMPRRKDK